ncbi:MAG: HipA domain-containing protein [Planctomycetota bacterium]
MKPTDIESLDVYRGHERIGSLFRTKKGADFQFTDPASIKDPKSCGLAFNIPFTENKVSVQGANLHPFFAGLLPEGLRLSALTRRVKTSADDLFSLLVAVGSECIGDISVVPKGEALPASASFADLSKPESLDFQELLRSSLNPDGSPEDMSLPGVQEKISGSMISFPLRANKTGAAFILKMNPPDRPLLVENEFFFLRMAKACGLEVAEAKLVHDRNGASALLVRRFDRVFEKGNPIPRKLHQEDGCQILDRYPADKYRISCQEISNAILEWTSTPALQQLRFLELYAFSYLIGNGDLHAKNVSLRISPTTDLVELSPAYDLLSTQAYRGLDQHMAMKLGPRDDKFRAKDFIEFGLRNGALELPIRKMLTRLCRKAEPWLDSLSEVAWPSRDRDRIARCLKDRIKRLP